MNSPLTPPVAEQWSSVAARTGQPFEIGDHQDLDRRTGESEMTHTAVGVDIVKNVFQLHWVEPETGEIVRRQIRRAAFLEHFVNRKSCLIGMEACSGAHHWARRLIEMGHHVKVMPARFVKAFVTGNKNDVADARVIWMALQQPAKAVAVQISGKANARFAEVQQAGCRCCEVHGL